MKLIEKIEIERFRSIARAEISTNHITIFSGLNNSGKSNVLKALDLFFNSDKRGFDFDKDYNKAFIGHAGGRRAVRIKLHFMGQGNAALKEPFWIERTFQKGVVLKQEIGSNDPKVQAAIEKGDGNIQRQFTSFVGKIEYFYVPAVRDRLVVRSLFLHFEKLIEHESGNKFRGTIDQLSNILKLVSKEISDDFQSFIGLPTNANLSSKITDILGTVEVNVRTGIKVVERSKKEGKRDRDIYVDLFSSGDGVLMSYLMYFLAHICQKISKKHFVWGFEEPENSLEYSKVQRIAEDLRQNFRKNAQILITTHSPALINLKHDESDVAFYRVFIKPDPRKPLTEIQTLNEIKARQLDLFNRDQLDSDEYQVLMNELHLVEFSNEIENAVKNVIKRESELRIARLDFEEKNKAILDTKPQKIFVCEDGGESTVALWKKWLGNDVAIFTSDGSTTKNIENWARQQKKIDPAYKPRIFRQLDRDGLTDEQVVLIEKELFSNEKTSIDPYEFKFLPVAELENFAILARLEYFTDRFWSFNQTAICDEFRNAAASKCRDLAKNFFPNTEKHKKFLESGQETPIVTKMQNAARREWRKYMNGKAICKKAQNCSPINILDNLTKDQFPTELKSYLKVIKDFYED